MQLDAYYYSQKNVKSFLLNRNMLIKIYDTESCKITTRLKRHIIIIQDER